jgi:hypothetical protein
MKVRLIIIFLAIQCLLFSSLMWAEDVSSAENKEDMELLSGLKNPFLTPQFPAPPKPKEPPKPVEVQDIHVPPPPPPPPRKVEPPVDVSTLHLNLEGVIWGDVNPKAIINGKVMEVGKWIEGAKVLSIDPKGIKMVYKGVKFMLTMDKGIMRIK